MTNFSCLSGSAVPLFVIATSHPRFLIYKVWVSLQRDYPRQNGWCVVESHYCTAPPRCRHGALTYSGVRSRRRGSFCRQNELCHAHVNKKTQAAHCIHHKDHEYMSNWRESSIFSARDAAQWRESCSEFCHRVLASPAESFNTGRKKGNDRFSVVNGIAVSNGDCFVTNISCASGFSTGLESESSSLDPSPVVPVIKI